MKIIDVIQGSPEWIAARLGVPSASNFAKVLTPGGKKSAQADAYVSRLIADILTGQPQSSEPNDAMQRGTSLEPEARAYYELISGHVKQIGFCVHDNGFGCSPDGLVGTDGLLEIKCPLSHTQVEYLRAGVLPSIYIPQVQGQMLVMERGWCDFLSYHPDMKPLLIRVERDEKYIKLLHDALNEIVAEINLGVEECRK